MATQLKVNQLLNRSKKLDQQPKRKESLLTHISKVWDSKKMDLPIRYPKEWLDKFWRDKLLELQSISSNPRRWQVELSY